jgi:hypothetical protein
MTAEEFFEQELSALERQWRAGYFPALREAVVFCHTAGAQVPQWLAEALVVELDAAFAGVKTTGRGRTGGHMARARAHQNDRARWEWACFFLSQREPGRGGRVIDGKLMTRDHAFELASEQLRGTPAQGSKDAVKASYERVQRQMRGPA